MTTPVQIFGATATPTKPKQSHKAHKLTNCTTFHPAWSPCDIRFSEELQLVDTLDVFTSICASPGAARVMHSKYFGGTGESLAPKICECAMDELPHPLVWSTGTKRVRNAIAVHHLRHIMQVASKTMPNAEALESILNVKKLTPSTACRYKTAATELTTVDSGADARIDSIDITKEKVLNYADSRTELDLYKNKVRADSANAEAMIAAKQSELIRYHSLAQLDQIKVAKEGMMAQDIVASQKRKLDMEEVSSKRKLEMEEITTKILLLRRLGKDDEAAELVAQLMAM